MPTQLEKAAAFRALHDGPDIFVLPNPWDVGTARMLAHLGFKALATTSAGHAFSLGRQDNTLGRDLTLAHVRDIVEATDLAVSADLGNCFGDDPGTVAETIRLAAGAGVAGASVEDGTGRAHDPVYEVPLAVERVRAAAEAARALSFPFTVTARAENFLVGRRDLFDTIARLQAYQDAGADVLYAPGLTTEDEIVSVIRAVDRPVNVLVGLKGFALDLRTLSTIGVRRVSTGSALSRAALGAFLRAARELRDRGTFGFNEETVPSTDIAAMLDPGQFPAG
jgi:2-methylisocitrate lyase-like PEP mutase family enzyme